MKKRAANTAIATVRTAVLFYRYSLSIIIHFYHWTLVNSFLKFWSVLTLTLLTTFIIYGYSLSTNHYQLVATIFIIHNSLVMWNTDLNTFVNCSLLYSLDIFLCLLQIVYNIYKMVTLSNCYCWLTLSLNSLNAGVNTLIKLFFDRLSLYKPFFPTNFELLCAILKDKKYDKNITVGINLTNFVCTSAPLTRRVSSSFTYTNF